MKRRTDRWVFIVIYIFISPWGESIIMLMTHVPKISVEKPYQKTGKINWHKNTACPIRYQKLIPEKFGRPTKPHVIRIRNRNRFSGTSFLAPISTSLSVSWA